MRTSSFISAIRDANFSSSWLRALLRLYYKSGRTYRIPFGTLSGLRMLYDRGMNFHSILGLSERHTFRILQRVLEAMEWETRSRVFVDLGANRGLYSLWFGLQPSAERVYSFEPNPELAKQLRTNLSLNKMAAENVFELACSNETGELEFFLGESDSVSSLLKPRIGSAEARSIRVRATSLDEFFFGAEKRGLGPDFIKMDIEGGGVFALPGCAECLSRKRPLLYVESHSEEEDHAIGDVLMKVDYQALRFGDMKWVENARGAHFEPNGVRGSLLLCPSEFQERINTALRLSPFMRWQQGTSSPVDVQKRKSK